MQLTAEQTEKLKAWAVRADAIEGDYSSTMLHGIMHFYCDSGIGTDALSKQDGERLREIISVDLTPFSISTLNDMYVQYRDFSEWPEDELQVASALDELQELNDEFGIADDDWEDFVMTAYETVYPD